MGNDLVDTPDCRLSVGVKRRQPPVAGIRPEPGSCEQEQRRGPDGPDEPPQPRGVAVDGVPDAETHPDKRSSQSAEPADD